jgi:hypothetical protein
MLYWYPRMSLNTSWHYGTLRWQCVIDRKHDHHKFLCEFITAFFNNNKKCLHIVNIDFLTKTIQSSTLQALMNKYNFKFIFLESAIINDTQINHIWTNASIQQCHFESTQAYCTNYKSIYFVFKLCSPICITIQYHKMSW